jgi:hypothetical protein
MKFIARNYPDKYIVQLEGNQEDQARFSTLVSNMYGIEACDSYSGQIIKFPNKTRFKKLLLWRAIFNQCAPNKSFSFMPFARRAVCEVKASMENDLIEVSC